MPHYVDDPKNPGKRIDVIQLLQRDPTKAPPPEGVISLMRRDNWTRQEALLILAGYAPSNQLDKGLPIGVPGAGIVYLDGTTNQTLANAGLIHPLENEILFPFLNLRDYSKGEPMDERRAPAEWITWADSKGFKPYWLEYWQSGSATPGASQEEPKGEAKASRTVHTMQGRTSMLDAEIDVAKKRTSNPQDYHSVWTELMDLALNEHGAFTGNTEGGKLEYEDNGKKEQFTKDALRKRMNPRAR